ncbi:hypothetical protein HanHA300_Chr03g0074241 [Helianthus annuus]|nr:hypothetical protein HanIR_Chr12g0612441 [Helianthus annuus]KAJ0591521.1 hypothetical protein HanHA300_Chr03g0074241 [Helianthus annuus]KAJ0606419.1 hypothetical protein HanHA89_Chr03g0084901 [Helianthus annuus]KAJ0766506.1 hypothetical protein HanLR1_Chr03g0078371 [Helianthus annuus]
MHPRYLIHPIAIVLFLREPTVVLAKPSYVRRYLSLENPHTIHPLQHLFHILNSFISNKSKPVTPRIPFFHHIGILHPPIWEKSFPQEGLRRTFGHICYVKRSYWPPTIPVVLASHLLSTNHRSIRG